MKITATAQYKLRSLLTEPGRAYRLSALAGGCQGYTFSLKIIHNPRPDDVLQSFSDLPFYIDRQSLDYLNDVTVDYVDGIVQGGFTFQHPQSCSCGKSFAPDRCPGSY